MNDTLSGEDIAQCGIDGCAEQISVRAYPDFKFLLRHGVAGEAAVAFEGEELASPPAEAGHPILIANWLRSVHRYQALA